MNSDDLAYNRKRALQEEKAGQATSCEAARKRHLELAALYRQRVDPESAPVADRSEEPAPLLNQTMVD